MTASLRKRILQGLGGQVISQVANVLIQILSVPVFLHFWGIGLYGEWLTLTALPLYLAISDVGFTTATQNEMTMRVGAGERAGALATFQSTWLLVTVFSIVAAVAIAALLPLLPLAEWFHFTRISQSETRWVVMLLCLYPLIHLQTGLLYCGFACEGNYGLGALGLALLRVTEFCALGTSLALGAAPIAAAAIWTATGALGMLCMRFVLYRKSPWVVFGWRHREFSIVKRLFPSALGFSAFALGTAFNLQGMVIAVGLALGPHAVVVYSTLRTLSRAARQAITTTTHVTMQPEMAMAFGAGNMDLMRILHRRCFQVALWVSFAIMLGLLIFGGWIYEIWTHGQVEMNLGLFMLLLAAAFVGCIALASLMAVYATNRPQKSAMAALLAYASAVFLAYPLAQWVGVAGAGAALLLAETAVLVYVLRQSLSFLGERPGAFLAAVAPPPLFLLQLLPDRRPRQP